MCGLTGYLPRHKVSDQVLRQMLFSIRHRGPDGSGTYYDDTLALGMCRLAIVDVKNGQQPFYSEDGRLVLTANGEIYNYQELRRQLLALGHQFATRSDIEVILHGYEEYGPGIFEKLRGMFAVALWDKKTQRLILARDSFGMKPIYYYQDGETFLFASEIKAFYRHPSFKVNFNESMLPDYIFFQHGVGNVTAFKDVYMVYPGEYVFYDQASQSLERHSFSQLLWPAVPSGKVLPKTEKQLEDSLDAALHDSVKQHLIGEVPIGSFLSSGVDSNFLTKISGIQEAFSVEYAEKEYNEPKDTEDGQVSLHQCMIDGESSFRDLPHILYHLDEPIADASVVPLYYLARSAAQNLKVILSGEGADELLAGYPAYQAPLSLAVYRQLPVFLRRFIGRIAELCGPGHGINFLYRNRGGEKEWLGNSGKLISLAGMNKILLRTPEKYHYDKIVMPYADLASGCDLVTKMQSIDCQTWLVRDILLKADKMSMASSLETRMPFLDKLVFKAAAVLPLSLKVSTEQTKIGFRQVAGRYLSSARANIPKKGFPFPIRRWLREGSYSQIVRESFHSAVAKRYFHTEYLERLLDEHIAGRKDNFRILWSVYAFLVWHQVFIQGESKLRQGVTP